MRGFLQSRTMKSAWIKAWLVCGTLDIAFATVATLLNGRDVGAMLRGVAAGPFGDAASDWGMAGSLLGLATHFTLMAVMVSVLALLMRRTAFGALNWLLAGTIYGFVLWLVMYGLVLPWRFGAPFPNPARVKAFIWFLPHLICVGWPLAYIMAFRTPGRHS